MKLYDWVRGLKPLHRFLVWAGFGVVTVVGMVIIGHLNDADQTGLALTWWQAVSVVLFMGILGLASRSHERSR